MLQPPFYIYLLYGCAVGSILLAVKNRTGLSRSTALFFTALAAVETVCDSLTVTDGVYNFWFPVEFTYYCYFAFQYTQSKLRYPLFFLQLAVFIFCYIHNFLNWREINQFFSFGYNLNALALFSFIIIKAYELLTDENDLRSPFRIPLVWFLLGSLLDVMSILLLGMKGYIISKNAELYHILQFSNKVISSLQYVCFIVFFYCSYKFQNWKW